MGAKAQSSGDTQTFQHAGRHWKGGKHDGELEVVGADQEQLSYINL